MSLSGVDPSLMLILHPLSSRKRLILSPFLPIILPTSLPCIISRSVNGGGMLGPFDAGPLSGRLGVAAFDERADPDCGGGDPDWGIEAIG